MMFLRIAIKDLKTMASDTKALAIILLMPLALIMVLGFALGDMLSGKLEVENFSIAVVDNDKGIMSDVIINSIFRESLGEMMETYVVSEEEAQKMLEENTVPSIVIIPEGFSENIENGKATEIEVRSRTDDTFISKIMESIVEGITDSFSLNGKGVNAIIEEMNSLGYPLPEQPIKNMSTRIIILQELQKNSSSQLLRFDEITEEKTNELSAFQYYSGTMLAMFILFGASLGSTLIIEERENKTLSRILASRPGKMTLIAGKLMGIFLICFVQSLVLIIFTNLIFGVNWGTSIIGLLVITISISFAAAGFGVMIASIAKTRGAASGIGQVLIQTFNLVGGGIIPIFMMPSIIKLFANIMPNYWALKSFHSLMLGAGIADILPSCGILLIVGLGYMSIGVWKFKVL